MWHVMCDLAPLFFHIDLRKKVELATRDKQIAGKDIFSGYTVVMNVPEPDRQGHIREVVREFYSAKGV